MKKVLIVDDEVSIADILEKFFSVKGFSVTKRNDAKSALLALEKGAAFDAIVIDAKMPGMSGEDFVKELRKKDKKTPVILFTGSINISPACKLYDRVLFKPARLSELLETVNEVLVSAPGQKHRKKKS
jgi:DNA-binding NtrC family response regulator